MCLSIGNNNLFGAACIYLVLVEDLLMLLYVLLGISISVISTIRSSPLVGRAVPNKVQFQTKLSGQVSYDLFYERKHLTLMSFIFSTLFVANLSSFPAFY